MSDEPMLDKDALSRFGTDPQTAKVTLVEEFDAFEEIQPALQSRWGEPIRPEAWSPAQLFEHVLKTNVSMSKVLYLLRRDAPLPDLPKKPANFVDGKPQSPEFALPGEPQPLEDLLPKWRETRERLLEEVEQTNAWHDRTMFHPVFGDLDALGWVQATSLHMAHHRKQLEHGHQV